jgi:ABC-type branched-subunit amino acid transport system substrate-binding protein
MRRDRALIASAVVLCLLGSACGSRLSERERTTAITAMSTRNTGGAVAGPATDGATSGPAVSGPTDAGPAATDDAGGGSSGGGSSGGGAQGGGGGGSAAAACRATKGTGTGVTANAIVVATLADINGVQPGLFQSAHDAANAAAAYINSEGGICGRQIKPRLLDSRTDSGANRATMLDACDNAFVVVGSMSAFDDGSAAPGEACGIPDITAISTNPQKYKAKNTYPAAPNGGDKVVTTPARFVKTRYPDVIKKAAMLWLNQDVTRTNSASRMKAYRTEGFDFIYQQEVQVLEADYTRFVIEMRNRGVQYVNMVSDFQSIVRLQKAMRQQSYLPKVRQWDSVAYDPDYLAAPEPVEGSLVFLNTAIVEEASSNPEMQLYSTWLKRTKPGAAPDYFGLYAWSAYRLFQKLATEIGADLTRPKFLAALRATKSWGANGLHAEHNIGAKQLSLCNLNLIVRGGKFVRQHPAKGFDCNGQIS